MPPELFAVMVALPAETAVSLPEAFTLQTEGLELLYFTLSVVLMGFSVGTRRKVSPTVIVFFETFCSREVAGTVRMLIVCTVLLPRWSEA